MCKTDSFKCWQGIFCRENKHPLLLIWVISTNSLNYPRSVLGCGKVLSDFPALAKTDDYSILQDRKHLSNKMKCFLVAQKVCILAPVWDSMSCGLGIRTILSKASIEPAYLLFAFGQGLHFIVVSELYTQKVCKVNLGLGNDICDELQSHKDDQIRVCPEVNNGSILESLHPLQIPK